MRVNPSQLNLNAVPNKGDCDSCKHKKKRKKAKNGKQVPSYWWDEAYNGTFIPDPNDPSKRRPSPYIQSNTFATSGTEDADRQKLANFDQISADQQQLMDDRYMSGSTDQDQGPKRQYQGNTFGGVSLAPIIGGALGAINNLLPNDIQRRPLAPQTAYNPYAYGTGSQAIMNYGGYIMEDGGGLSRSEDYGSEKKPYPSVKSKDFAGGGRSYPIPTRADAIDALRLAGLHGRSDVKAKVYKKYPDLKKENGGYVRGEDENNTPMAKDGKWIQKAVNPAHKGYCTPMTKKTCTPRRKALAKRFKSGDLSHENGGIIPDPMSVFNPHEYEHGGNVNGGAHVREVGADYPNADLMEQWLLYQDGGPIRPPLTIFNNPSDRMRYIDSLKGVNAGLERDYQFWSNADVEYMAKERAKKEWTERHYFDEAQRLANREHTMYRDPQIRNLEAIKKAENPYQLYMPKDTIVKKKKEDGGPVPPPGRTKFREVGATYPNADLLEQWLEYRDGGQLSPSKAKEMLRDGTANGKKLTKKQKRYFGMVAAGKAAVGDVVTGDPPIGGGEINPNSSYYSTNPLQRGAKYADQLNELIAKGYDPYSSDWGKAALNVGRERYSPAFSHAVGARIKALQTDPYYKRMNEQQRLDRFYNNPSGSPEVDEFIKTVKPIGGSPSAFYASSPAVPTLRFKEGGVMYNDGGDVRTLWGGDAEIAAYNPYDGGTIEFSGASHDDGGIGMAYNGNPVEVEGGEFGARDTAGNMNIFGNMNFPGSSTKFKSIAKKMAEKEKRYDFLKNRGSQLVNSANPADKYEQLTFNSGQLMMHGGSLGQKDIAAKKANLSALQKAMLDTADEFGLDASHMSKGKIKKAKGGTSIPFFANGGGTDPTMADRNNNPGNIKWGKFAKSQGAKKGPPASDGGFFAIFPSREKGLSAMKSLLKSKSYKDLDVNSAINKWTNNRPYDYNLQSLGGKKVGQLNDAEFETLVNTMQRGEGTKYGSTPRRAETPRPEVTAPPFTPYGLPPAQVVEPPATPRTRRVVNPPPVEGDFPDDAPPIPSNTEGLHPVQLLGEMYSFATNDVEPVPHLRYDPMLHTPFQMSFQDRLNENQASFSALQRTLGPQNPAALGVLAGQKYQADNAVRADEFRTNQAIANDVTNKNVSILNDAQLKNLALADTQSVRQSQAKSNTRAQNQLIFNSISDKFMKNKYENRRLAAYENLYDYRFMPGEEGGLKATYYGPDAVFNYNGTDTGRAPADKRTITRYDQYGNMKGYSEYDDYDLREQQRLLDLEMKKRKLPLLGAPPLQ